MLNRVPIPSILTSIVTAAESWDGESREDLVESIISGIRCGINAFASPRIRDLYSSIALADRPGLITEEHVRHVLDEEAANRFTIFARCIREAVILLPESLGLHLALVLRNEEVSGHRAAQIELEGRPRHVSMFLTEDRGTEWLRMETWRSTFQIHLFDMVTGIWRIPLKPQETSNDIIAEYPPHVPTNSQKLSEKERLILAVAWGNGMDDRLFEEFGVTPNEAQSTLHLLVERGITQTRYIPDLSVAGLSDEVFMVYADPSHEVRPHIERIVPFCESVVTSKGRTVMRLYVPPNPGIMLASYLRRNLSEYDPAAGLVKKHVSARTHALLSAKLR